MGQYSVVTSDQARKQLATHYKAGNNATIKRIEKIFENLANHPYSGVGRPEPLKYGLSGYWSRELNKKDRIVYQVNDEALNVSVVSTMGHYGDK
jgi:toxin YoeB